MFKLTLLKEVAAAELFVELAGRSDEWAVTVLTKSNVKGNGLDEVALAELAAVDDVFTAVLFVFPCAAFPENEICVDEEALPSEASTVGSVGVATLGTCWAAGNENPKGSWSIEGLLFSEGRLLEVDVLAGGRVC